MKYTVGVFTRQGKKKLLFSAYTQWYSPTWDGCCEHRVEAETGMMAKARAIYAHQHECVAKEPEREEVR